MFNARDFALNMLRQNPNIANNPNAQEMINVIQNGDSVRGQQIANNLCSTYGMNRDQAISQAMQFFHIR